MRPGPSFPRRPFLLAPLALAACSAGPSAPDDGRLARLLAERGAALVAGDLTAAGAGYAPADRNALRVLDGRAVRAGLAAWAYRGGPWELLFDARFG